MATKKSLEHKEYEQYITIEGARVNNLKNISLKIPRDKLVVISGLSGSGKSSLAFETLFIENKHNPELIVKNYASNSEIISTRIWCLPPINSASKYAFTMSFASSLPTIRAPNAITFALLCSFVAAAEKQSEQRAQRIPGTLFAEMEIPIPVPQIMIPHSHSPEATAFAAARPYSG
jgi:ABC-type dipeptide/oligopeptide/nickel transport system ATPase component